METLTYKTTEIRATSALTGSYVAGNILGNSIIGDNTKELYIENQLLLYINIANLGNMTSVQAKVEFSDDQTNWYQETFEQITGGTAADTLGEHAFSSTGGYRLAIPLKDRYVKVSFKGTGGSGTGSLVSCIAVHGTA